MDDAGKGYDRKLICWLERQFQIVINFDNILGLSEAWRCYRCWRPTWSRSGTRCTTSSSSSRKSPRSHRSLAKRRVNQFKRFYGGEFWKFLINDLLDTVTPFGDWQKRPNKVMLFQYIRVCSGIAKTCHCDTKQLSHWYVLSWINIIYIGPGKGLYACFASNSQAGSGRNFSRPRTNPYPVDM